MPNQQPNVLVLMDDQHHAGCLSCDERPQVQTPNIDRLARDGVNFQRGYASCCECVPSRISFLTGMYPHVHGVYNDGKSVHPDSMMTMPRYLREQLGYYTGIIGKRHFGTFPTDPFESSTGEDQAGYYGYLESIGLRDKYKQEFLASMKQFGAYQSDIPFEYSEPTWVADRTINWIDQHGDKPFFLWTNWSDPHPPYRTASDYPVQYDPDEIDVSQIRNSSAEAERLMRLSPQAERYGVENVWNRQVNGERAWREALAHYYGMISAVDHSVGRIVNHLEQRGLLENTIILFTADHGDFAGEFGMLGKNTRGHYEPIQRVPTIWYWKNNFGPELVQSFTTNLDIFPTVCDLVGLEPPLQTQGNSVADILRFSPSGPGPGPESSEMVFFDSSFTKSVRTRQYMLSYYESGTSAGRLHDIRKDPDQIHNVYDDPAYTEIRRNLEFELLRWFMRTDQPRFMSGADKLHPPTRWHTQFSEKLNPNKVRLGQ